MNLLSFILIGVALLGVSLVVNGTFNHEYDLSRISIQEAQSLNVTDIADLKGDIISLHKNHTANPAWIVSGKWNLVYIPGNNTDVNATGNNTDVNATGSNTDVNATMQNVKFDTSLVMSNVDGTDSHRHRISGFKLTNLTFLHANVIIDGTFNMTTTGDKDVLDNNIDNIPARIQIPNLKTIKIEIENKIVKEHFGGTPIYGKVD